MHDGECVDLSAHDADALGLDSGNIARITSRRGSVTAPVRVDPALRPGLVFLSIHAPDIIDVNALVSEESDPLSGVAEFKAVAVRIERVDA
jgi:formate dehydrogenase major subunit